MTRSSEVDDRRSKLSPAKRALLDMRLRGSASPVSPLAGSQVIGRRPGPEASLGQNAATAAVSLSFAQERLWFLDQWQPGDPAYNRPVALRLSGALDVRALERALGEILRRHEVLRAAFPAQDGHPVQVIGPAQPVHLTVTDLEAWPSAERESEARRLAAEETQRPFDLARGPVLRARLLRLGPAEQVLLIVVHHIAFDAWSARVLANELATLYQAFHDGQPSPLPELPIQYADYAYWQQQWLQGSVLEAQLAYWREQLAALQTPLDLPTDRPRPPARTHHGGYQLLVLPTPLVGSLQAVSQRENGTLFMALLAAFQVLLYRYTGQEDIVVGSPSAGRHYVEVEPLIGFFLNNLVLRTDLLGNPSFRELLGRVRAVALGAFAHQDLPFQKLVEMLNPERDPSRTPLFQALLNLEHISLSPVALQDLEIEAFEFDDGIARFDLALELAERPDGLGCHLNYSTDLFEAATAQRMLGHYQTLLEAIVVDPEQRISALPLLTSAEKHQLLVTWNDTQAHYARDRSVHQLFEAQVLRTPKSVAVVFQDQRLSYHDLHQRANQLAHHLRRLGVGPEVLVGLCVERSLDMVVGQLGILKAGGAYVPLDPTYPPERLAFIQAETRTPVLLAQHALMDRLPGSAARLIRLDSDWATIAQESPTNLASDTWPEQPAYVVYTSGSTGTPNGIVIPHRAVSRLVSNTNYIEVEPGDRVAQTSNASFDAAAFEVWGALLRGAQLVILPQDVVLSPQELCAQLQNQGITTLFLTTALFNLLAREVPGAFRSLRYLLFGGETADPHWVRQVLRNDPPKRLLHLYGPAESTTFASWYRVLDVAEGATTVPIGHPISNTQIYLLDAHLEPVPMGVVGELYLGGDGLVRGYLNQPALTAERFIPHPFAAEAGSRLYRTGDLARYRCDGTIEFLGRADRQVKIRGFRVELGEIEAVLAQHPAVRQAVVLAKEVAPGDQRLVAYLVPKQHPAPASAELQAFLKQKLPAYMVPSAYVQLDRLPLTPTGKIDYAALPAPDTCRSLNTQVAVRPQTPTEAVLAEIWRGVLGVDQPGVYDNFFDLGGHSLLSIQVVAKIEERLGARVTPMQLML